MKFKLSVVTHLRDNYPTDITLSYDELAKLLTTFPSQLKSKFNNQGFVAGHFDGKQRLTSNLLSRTLITLDVDKYNSDLTSLEALLKRELHGQWYIAYSTSSHTFKKPKIRIVILLDKEVKAESYRTVTQNFVYGLEIAPFLDEASFKPNQFMFYPSRPNDSYLPWSVVNEGELLNPDYYCVDYGFVDLTNDNQGLVSIKDKKVKVVDNKVNLDNMILTIKNQPLDLTDNQISDTLIGYKADKTNYNTWIEVGMALSHQYSGSKKGLQIWYDWSKLDSRYDKKKIYNEVSEKWSSFGKTSNPIKFSTIMKKAQEGKVIKMNTILPPKDAIEGNISRTKFIHTKGEKLTPLNTIENFKVILNEYNIDIKYDVILKRKEISFDGYIEADLNKAQARLESLCIQNSIVGTSVAKYMGLAEKEGNSWRDWIESVVWDGKDRFLDLCATIKVADELEKIKHIYLRTWLMQMIHLTCLNDAPKAKMGRFVLVFQSNQWAGKTTWFTTLCPTSHQKYLQEGVSLDTKDHMSVKECIEHVFVELGEIGSTFRKSDADNLKNFISKTTDLINEKYITHHKEFRRRTVFFGSVNDHVFLQDTTGSTRFLALPIISCDYEHTIDMQQLYAQLYLAAKNGETYKLDNESLIKQKDLNSEFENPSYLEEKFSSIFNTELESRNNLISIPGILELLGFMPSSIKQSHMNEMSRILKNLGYTRRTNKPRHWQLPPRR
jgi:hypothetical protein